MFRKFLRKIVVLFLEPDNCFFFQHNTFQTLFENTYLSLNGYRVAIIYIYTHDDDDDDDDDVNFLLMHNIMQDLATISTCNWSKT